MFKNLEYSLNSFIATNFSTIYGYNVNYGSVNYKSEGLDSWVDISFSEINAGFKQKSFAQADFYARVLGSTNYVTEKKLAIERFVTVMTNPNIPLYDYTDENSPTLISGNKVLIQNNQGRFAVNRVVFDALTELGLHRSTVFFNVVLLSDKPGGLYV
jgi:hypothetical protein